MHDVNILGGMKKSVYLLLLLFIVGCKHSSDSKLTAFATRISPDLGQPKRVAPHLKHYLKYDADTIAFTNVTIIDGTRSEEHTSELQSRENLVCRLLLEKKKLHPVQRATTATR